MRSIKLNPEADFTAILKDFRKGRKFIDGCCNAAFYANRNGHTGFRTGRAATPEGVVGSALQINI